MPYPDVPASSNRIGMTPHNSGAVGSRDAFFAVSENERRARPGRVRVGVGLLRRTRRRDGGVYQAGDASIGGRSDCWSRATGAFAPDELRKRYPAGPTASGVHRHRHACARAPDQAELEHRRCRNEAERAVTAGRCLATPSRRKEHCAGQEARPTSSVDSLGRPGQSSSRRSAVSGRCERSRIRSSGALVSVAMVVENPDDERTARPQR
jgi:hypothetical protein